MDLYFLLQHLNTIIIPVILLVVPLFLFILPKRNKQGIQKLPPGPTRLPLIGNLHLLNDLPHRSLRRLSLKYGNLMLLHLGSKPTLVVSSADMVSEIVKTHDLTFSSRPSLYAAKRISYECTDIVFGPYGEHWRELRKIAVLELFSVKKVESFRTARKEEVAMAVASIASSHGPIDLSDTILRLGNNIVCKVVFGRNYQESNNGTGVHELLLEAQDLLGGFCAADFFPWLEWIHKLDGLDARLEKVFRILDEFYDRVIEEHLDPKRPKQEVEDLVDVMLRLQRDPSHKFALNNTHIKGVLTDMFIAGTDTSSATLVWAMTELIMNPISMKKTQEEVRRIVGKKEIVEENDLSELNYLKLVVKEALRLHPPAPLPPRETTDKCTIQGYTIPAKTRVFINVKAIAIDPKSWENPEEFYPERFLGSHLDFRGQDYEYIPFGFGRRSCPAINFAIAQIELVLANLLHCFNWELPHGLERGDIDMKEAFGITTHKKIPLCLIATKHKTF